MNKRTATLILITVLCTGCVPPQERQPVAVQPTVTQPTAQYGHDTIIRRAAEAEHRHLRRIAVEIAWVTETMLPQARYHADPDARIRFDWHQLEIDLRRIVSGIEAHLDAGMPAPRRIEPIAGDYSR